MEAGHKAIAVLGIWVMAVVVWAATWGAGYVLVYDPDNEWSAFIPALVGMLAMPMFACAAFVSSVIVLVQHGSPQPMAVGENLWRGG